MIRHLPNIVLGIAAAQTVAFAVYLAQAVFTVPFWDTLDWIDAYYRAPDVWTWLWQQHGDVRTLASKALLALDLSLFEGALYPIAALAFAAMVATQLAVARLAYDDQTTRLTRAIAGALPFILIFQTFTLPSYMAPNTVQHAMALVFFLCAVLPLIGPANGRPLPRWRFWLAAVAALLATFAYPNGFIAWAAAAWLAWRRRQPITWTVGFAAVCALVAMAYFAGYRWGDGHPNPAAAFDAPLRLLQFIVWFLGMPWIRYPALEWPGMAIGAVLLGLGVYAIIRETMRHTYPGRIRLLAVVMFAFAIGSVLMVGLVRAELTDFRDGGTRFGIFAALAQLAAVLYLMPSIGRLGPSNAAKPVVLAAGAGLVLVLAAQQAFIGAKAAVAGGEIALVRGALEAGVETEADLRTIYPDPERAREIIALIRRNGDYGMSDEPTTGPAQRLQKDD